MRRLILPELHRGEEQMVGDRGDLEEYIPMGGPVGELYDLFDIGRFQTQTPPGRTESGIRQYYPNPQAAQIPLMNMEDWGKLPLLERPLGGSVVRLAGK